MTTDVDDDAVMASPKKKSRPDRVFASPDGPLRLIDVLLLPATQVTEFCEFCKKDSEMLAHVTAWVKAGLVVTTSFTGFGCLELVINANRKLLARLLGVVPGPIVFYAAWELSKAAQTALLNHTATRPLHLFEDVLQRVPGFERGELTRGVDEKLQTLALAKKECKLGSITRKEYLAEAKELERANLNALRAGLEDLEFEATTKCLICKSYCCINPRANLAYKDYTWLEVAGTTCSPFSTLSDNPCWLDPSTFAVLSWAYATRYDEPDEIGHECVQYFKHEVFQNILVDTASRVKSPWASPDFVGEGEGGAYDMEHATNSPVDFGAPSERRRKWSWLKRKSGRSGKKFDVSIEQLFFKKLVASPSIYMAAPDSWRVAEDQLMATQKAKRTSRRGPSSSTEDSGDDPESERAHVAATCGGDFDRFACYRIAAIDQGLCSDDGRIWQVPVALANITQRVEFIKQINGFSVPALLRRAMLVDLVKGNRMLLPEMWLAQGFPYPGLAKTYDPTVLEYLEELFPFKDLVIVQHDDTDVEEGDGLPACSNADEAVLLTLKEQRSLIGNTMHPVQVSAWILFNILR